MADAFIMFRRQSGAVASHVMTMRSLMAAALSADFSIHMCNDYSKVTII